MKTRQEYTKEEFIEELQSLWAEVVDIVYLKSPSAQTNEWEFAWAETKLTPLAYVKMAANPSNITNQVIHGQKAREKRWKKWLSSIENKGALCSTKSGQTIQ